MIQRRSFCAGVLGALVAPWQAFEYGTVNKADLILKMRKAMKAYEFQPPVPPPPMPLPTVDWLEIRGDGRAATINGGPIDWQPGEGP